MISLNIIPKRVILESRFIVTNIIDSPTLYSFYTFSNGL